MLKSLFSIIAAVLFSISTFASTPKILVAYFSRAGENWQVGNVERGNTAIMGDYIIDFTGADVFEIEPVVPYPEDYYETINVAREETNNNARPEFKGAIRNLDDYEIVFIGSPIWNGAPPMIMHTFYEAYPNLGIKTLVPFGTHGGSGISSCERVMKEYFPNAKYLNSLGISGEVIRNTSSKETVEKWLNEIGILPIMADSETPDAVDLGLSIKWATYNVGATQPNDYGKLYGWADPSGDQTSETLEDYPSEEPPVSICGTEYDIATVNWGNQWRMPTQAECVELAENCSWEWTEMDGINGMKVTGKNGNSIFLPAAASRTGDKISNQVGQRGCYWSGTLWPDNSNFASYLYFYSDASRVQPSRSNRRYIGMSVRPVYIEGGAGIENVEIDKSSQFSVSIDGYILRIDNLSSNTPVSIYDTMGRLIYHGIKHTINVEKGGIYFIKENSYTKKILIR